MRRRDRRRRLHGAVDRLVPQARAAGLADRDPRAGVLRLRRLRAQRRLGERAARGVPGAVGGGVRARWCDRGAAGDVPGRERGAGLLHRRRGGLRPRRRRLPRRGEVRTRPRTAAEARGVPAVMGVRGGGLARAVRRRPRARRGRPRRRLHPALRARASRQARAWPRRRRRAQRRGDLRGHAVPRGCAGTLHGAGDGGVLARHHAAPADPHELVDDRHGARRRASGGTASPSATRPTPSSTCSARRTGASPSVAGASRTATARGPTATASSPRPPSRSSPSGCTSCSGSSRASTTPGVGCWASPATGARP